MERPYGVPRPERDTIHEVDGRRGGDRGQARSAHEPASAPVSVLPAPRSIVVLEDPTREQVVAWRSRAHCDHQVVLDQVDSHAEFSARRLFTSTFVDQVLRLASTSILILGVNWEQA
ncbi:hypothetical protein [Streptomyces sp. NPDC087317]|uniref:hypothetical protein n=1 Tax=Streptomyces sp. NPDC087317 TaxID=3365784 RepID=UPI0037F8148F